MNINIREELQNMYTKEKNASMNTNIKNQCKIKPIVYDH